MVENKFKVGDEIVGNKLATEHYNFTRKGVEGIVTDIVDENNIRIQLIGDSGTYGVKSMCFDLVKSAEPKEINNVMEKIYTYGCDKLKEFFDKIGIGGDNNENKHLVGEGYGGYLHGTIGIHYYVDENGLFQAQSKSPKDYIEVTVEYFIEYHTKRLSGEIGLSKEINNYEIF